MKSKVEILAPAGSYQSMVAAINAGADAVYMGGSRFGARAFAQNPAEDDFLKAIDYVHLHKSQIYMTVNTLVKEQEMGQLYEFLHPYYQQGLDAAIVQDLGVLSFLKEQFPKLSIHASTQMTITGYHGAKILKEMGADRIVTARELSLEEIARIHKEVDIEIESFVHGALCYCYSGQCLMSSFIGGRSGNRGRCAQPCRLPYDIGNKKSEYLLSLKDLCTLDILPDIIEAGVYSLKIEGRMKSPRYTAGVVSVYRKYVDLYRKEGKAGYHVEKKDKDMLLELFDRGGFTGGYYTKHNGKDMVVIKEKPAFRQGNQALFDAIDETYVNVKKQESIDGYLWMEEGQPASLSFTLEDGEAIINGSAFGDVVQTAQNQPITEEKVRKQIGKTGSSPFVLKQLEVSLQGNCFMPVQGLNELRRNALESLEKQILELSRREAVTEISSSMERLKKVSETRKIHALVQTKEQLEVLLSYDEISEIYLDAVGFEGKDWQGLVKRCHQIGTHCSLRMPHIFRKEAETYFIEHKSLLLDAGFDELVVCNIEEVDFLKEQEVKIPLVFDASMYTMNERAQQEMFHLGATRLTLPLELNSKELGQIDCSQSELVVYGYLPAMVSAQCIVKTTSGCRKVPQTLTIKDRMGKELQVKNHCKFCYNTIYNTTPLSLLGQKNIIEKINPAVIRLQFTTESREETKKIAASYVAGFIHHVLQEEPVKEFTRGHLKRGIE